MGSSSGSPKRNDRVPLPRLKKVGSGSGGGASGSGGDYGSEEATCPLVFRAPLNIGSILVDGKQLLIGASGVIQFGGHNVGKLTPRQWTTYQRCSVQGVKYAGTVIIIKKGRERTYYAEFRQR